MAKRGLEGNMMAQPRIFGHDARGLKATAIQNGEVIVETEGRGVALYIGKAMSSIVVTMESGTAGVTFKGIAAGSFLPILVTHVTAATPSDTGATLEDSDIIALY